MVSVPEKLLVLNEAMIFFICASCSANGFQSARKSRSFCEEEVEDGLSEQGLFRLWFNSLIMLYQTVFLCVFSSNVFINFSSWSSVKKKFRKIFKFLSECIHPAHNCTVVLAMQGKRPWEHNIVFIACSGYMGGIAGIWCWDFRVNI